MGADKKFLNDYILGMYDCKCLTTPGCRQCTPVDVCRITKTTQLLRLRPPNSPPGTLLGDLPPDPRRIPLTEILDPPLCVAVVAWSAISFHRYTVILLDDRGTGKLATMLRR